MHEIKSFISLTRHQKNENENMFSLAVFFFLPPEFDGPDQVAVSNHSTIKYGTSVAWRQIFNVVSDIHELCQNKKQTIGSPPFPP